MRKRRKLGSHKSLVLKSKRLLKKKQNKNRMSFKVQPFRKRMNKNVFLNVHKHFCSFCGASADVDGSLCYQGIFACPRHVNRAIATYFKLSGRGQN